ncbi:MAG: RNA methyltransferase [Candidatus Krumholzibacteriota bacterium]
MTDEPLTITSLQNDRVKELVRLRSRRERDRLRLTLIEEPLVISRALDAGYPLQTLFFCPGRIATEHKELLDRLLEVPGLEIIKVDEAVMDKISYREQAEGLLLVAPQLTRELSGLELRSSPLLVVLEAVEKPGNLGAVLRVADGAGADAVIVCGGGTDLFNPNVLRASRGSFFSVQTVAADTETVQEFLRSRSIAAVATSPVADHRWDEIGLDGPTAIILGSEHDGLSATWLTGADLTVGIPMLGTGDSLNVSTSAAVLLYEAVRQRSSRKEDRS